MIARPTLASLMAHKANRNYARTVKAQIMSEINSSSRCRSVFPWYIRSSQNMSWYSHKMVLRLYSLASNCFESFWNNSESCSLINVFRSFQSCFDGDRYGRSPVLLFEILVHVQRTHHLRRCSVQFCQDQGTCVSRVIWNTKTFARYCRFKDKQLHGNIWGLNFCRIRSNQMAQPHATLLIETELFTKRHRKWWPWVPCAWL